MSRQRKQLTTRLNVESLENREVPSITMNQTTHVWTATGTEQSDIIIVDRQPNNLVNLRIRIFDDTTGALREQDVRTATNVNRVEVLGLGGIDLLINWTSKPSSLSGGSGSDTLIGGFGNDTLVGGSGYEDYIFTDSLPVVANWAGSVIFSVIEPVNAPAVRMLGTDHIREEGTYDYYDKIDLSGIKAGVSLDLAQIDVAQTVQADRSFSLFLESANGQAGIEYVYGTDYDDSLRGDAGDNRLFGLVGNDTLEGRGGNDSLHGSEGSDTYLFRGSNLGTDRIYERDGTDTLDFSQLDSAVNLDLNSTTTQTVSANNLILTPGSYARNDLQFIESVVGSRFGDTIRGNALANRLVGMNGNDILEGRGGDDELLGGEGSDTYVFAGLNLGHDSVHEVHEVPSDVPVQPVRDTQLLVGDTLNFNGFGAAIKLNLGFSTRQTVAVGNLELTLDNRAGRVASIENVIGSQFNDMIAGNALNNWIDGVVGNDTIYGLSGNDTLIGGRGSDTLYGGEDDDYLYGLVPGATSSPVGERDVLDGEGGTDYMETWFFYYVNGVLTPYRYIRSN